MPTTMNSKGQVTIPGHIRDALKLDPGCRLDFVVDSEGNVVMRKLDEGAQRRRDRFEQIRGKADAKWKTDELMALLRGEDRGCQSTATS